jgi:hypothetical protein
MFTSDRHRFRQAFAQAWRKAQTDQRIEPLEQQIVQVVRQHPEYHAALEGGDDLLERDWLPEGGETNPFLHLGLHLGLQEQVSMDSPPGIRKLYRQMLETCRGDVHEAEHRLMDCLAEAMWKLQRDGGALDTNAMLECIKARGGGRGAD